MFRINAPISNEPIITKKAFSATRRASERRSLTEAFCVMLRNMSAAPGGLTTGKSVASTSKKVSTIFKYPFRTNCAGGTRLVQAHNAGLFGPGAVGLRLLIPHRDGAVDAVSGAVARACRAGRCSPTKHVSVRVDVFKSDIEPAGTHGIAAQLRKWAPDQVDDSLLYVAVKEGGRAGAWREQEGVARVVLPRIGIHEVAA